MVVVIISSLSLAHKLACLFEDKDIIHLTMNELKVRELNINNDILRLSSQLRDAEPILIYTTEDKNDDIIKGSRCRICGKVSTVQCYSCKNKYDVVSGYCDHHKHKHIENGGHTAIFIPVTELKTIKETKEQLTPEQQLKALEIKRKELQQLIEDKTKDIEIKWK